MNKEAHDAVRKVLKEAGEHGHFFDFSDAERLAWMIERAYALGRRKDRESNTFGKQKKRPARCD